MPGSLSRTFFFFLPSSVAFLAFFRRISLADFMQLVKAIKLRLE
eukprot:CAMPEP_0182507732 /NCGR_PEP_ID=MMETSP1321-20130603/23737_1 /TAXON_ID=91990 /ORGANISM="Bolidomonas sp., Strain RCC1657" /LENGTH=43 /DNA_ID= /DNA_START= /DNA_END= /DNA_ORIENTATION=